jgi:hypothetical protein
LLKQKSVKANNPKKGKKTMANQYYYSQGIGYVGQKPAATSNIPTAAPDTYNRKILKWVNADSPYRGLLKGPPRSRERAPKTQSFAKKVESMKYPVVDHIFGHWAQVGPIPTIPPQEYNKGILKNPKPEYELKMQPATAKTKMEIFNNHYGIVDPKTGQFKNRLDKVPPEVFTELDNLEARGFRRNVILSLRRKLKLGDLTALDLMEKTIFENIIKQLGMLPTAITAAAAVAAAIPGVPSGPSPPAIAPGGRPLPPGFKELEAPEKEEEEKYPEEEEELGQPVEGVFVPFEEKKNEWTAYVLKEMELKDEDDRYDAYMELLEELEELEHSKHITPDESRDLYLILDDIHDNPPETPGQSDPPSKKDTKHMMINLTNETIGVIHNKKIPFDEARTGALNTIKQLNDAVEAGVLTRKEGNKLVQTLLTSMDKIRRKEIPPDAPQAPTGRRGSSVARSAKTAEAPRELSKEDIDTLTNKIREQFAGLKGPELDKMLKDGMETYHEMYEDGEITEKGLEIIFGILDVEYERAGGKTAKAKTAKAKTAKAKTAKVARGRAALASSVAIWKKDVMDHGITEDNKEVGSRILKIIKKGRKNDTLSKKDGTELMSVIRKVHAEASIKKPTIGEKQLPPSKTSKLKKGRAPVKPKGKITKKTTKAVVASRASVKGKPKMPTRAPPKAPQVPTGRRGSSVARSAKTAKPEKPEPIEIIEEVISDEPDIPAIMGKRDLNFLDDAQITDLFNLMIKRWAKKNKKPVPKIENNKKAMGKAVFLTGIKGKTVQWASALEGIRKKNYKLDTVNLKLSKS